LRSLQGAGAWTGRAAVAVPAQSIRATTVGAEVVAFGLDQFQPSQQPSIYNNWTYKNSDWNKLEKGKVFVEVRRRIYGFIASYY
jgi:hypothetical protein